MISYLLQNPPVLAAICTLAGTLVGACVAAGMAFWLNHQSRKADELRHVRDLAVRIALEEWKMMQDRDMQIAKMNCEKNRPWSVNQEPIVNAVLRGLQIAEAIANKQRSEG